MAVPKRKTSKSKNGMRQAGKGLRKLNNLIFDNNGNAKMFHNTIFKRVKKEKNTQIEENNKQEN